MDLGIKDRTALIGGASRGLGLAVAQALAAEGCHVAICARSAGQLEEAAERIAGQHGVRALWRATDLGDGQSAHETGLWALEHFGAVDILVNNNGGPPPGQWADFDQEHWRAAVEKTLFSAQAMTRAVLPKMLEQNWGRVINLTSISVKQPLPGLMLSNAVRAAVVGWAKSLADEVAPFGVTVNNVCPGWILTQRVQDILQARSQASGQSAEDILAGVLEGIPARRVGRPEEIGALAAFLASNQAAYITGASLAIDGGLCRAML
ncbi:SDR family oxidoreductase [Desulfarculus baarsii]